SIGETPSLIPVGRLPPEERLRSWESARWCTHPKPPNPISELPENTELLESFYVRPSRVPVTLASYLPCALSDSFSIALLARHRPSSRLCKSKPDEELNGVCLDSASCVSRSMHLRVCTERWEQKSLSGALRVILLSPPRLAARDLDSWPLKATSPITASGRRSGLLLISKRWR